MELTNTCIICGVEQENTYHTFCRCPMARNLWQAMSEIWHLPAVEEMPSTNSEWVLHMLDRKTETERVMIMMMLWRICYCRNEVIHQKPAPSIESSRHFLSSYLIRLKRIYNFLCSMLLY
jgi:hypothetical protein